MNMRLLNTLLLVTLLVTTVFSQSGMTSEECSELIQPTPKSLTSLHKTIRLDDSSLNVFAVKSEEQKAANYLGYIFNKSFSMKISGLNGEPELNNFWLIRIELIPFEKQFVNDQYYTIKCDEKAKEILIQSPGQFGLLYGVVTLSDLIVRKDESLYLNLCDVTDWPDYSRRMVHSIPEVNKVDELLDYALRYKMETVTIAHRLYSWFTVEDEYLQILKEIKEWKDKFGGPHIMQMHNVYDPKYINIADENDVNALKHVIKTSIEYGVDKLMILADDTPPFKYGEGYILTYDEEKEKFQHFAESQSALMWDIKNWLADNSLSSELYYVSGFYTYEDMHYGDIRLFDNTPWEDDAYKPMMRDLNYLGLNLPDDVFFVWCGPVVRSRKITVDDLNDWTYNLKGRVPFLWDNTIYSHHPFTSTPLFSAYDNELPSDFFKRTAGNGMTINGDANAEDYRVAVITAMDYLWNSESYDPEKSLNRAMNNYYGEELTPLLFEFKETELGLRRTIGERRLWFEADTLWQAIREARWVHTKNPFYYHYNYTRMKALRLQLKNSVPEPVTKEEFVAKCYALDKQRQSILNEVKTINPNVFDRVKTIAVPLPDFEKLQ